MPPFMTHEYIFNIYDKIYQELLENVRVFFLVKDLKTY
jgi:hypothetical protein